MSFVTNPHKLGGLTMTEIRPVTVQRPKSDISITGWTSRCPQGHTPSEGCREGSVSCLFQLLVASNTFMEHHSSLKPASSNPSVLILYPTLLCVSHLSLLYP